MRSPKIFSAMIDKILISRRPAAKPCRIILHFFIWSLGGGSASGHWHIAGQWDYYIIRWYSLD